MDSKMSSEFGQARCSSGNMRLITLPLLVFLLTLFAGPALAVHPYQEWADELGIDLNVSYDGTRVMELEGGMFEAREYRAPGKMYTEMQMQGMSAGIIMREDLGKTYLLMPSMGMYSEESLEGGLAQASNGMKFSQIEMAGTDTVLGHPSTKYKMKFTDNDGKGAGFVWVTDSGIPIKMDMIYSSKDVQGMRVSMEFTELHIREQDPAVFELPEGLNPMNFSGMAGLDQLMPGGGQTGGPATSAVAGEVARQMIPGGALGAAAADSMTPGMSQQPQAAPAGSAATATKASGPSSAELTTDNMVQSVQLHLQELGYKPGNTSGDLDLDTQIAISEFEASKGRTPTGEASPIVLGILSAEVDSRR